MRSKQGKLIINRTKYTYSILTMFFVFGSAFASMRDFAIIAEFLLAA
jgi:hypothetical protein